MEIKRLEQQKKAMEEEKRQFDESQKLERERLAEQKRQFDAAQKASAAQIRKSSTIAKAGSAATKAASAVNKQSYAVNTDYYQGNLNPDVKNGVMKNGYQPDNVFGSKLSKTGDTIVVNTQTLSGEKRTVTQNVWKDQTGKLWYWEGRQNRYIRISNSGGGGRSF